jgi:hypothetical protein
MANPTMDSPYLIPTDQDRYHLVLPDPAGGRVTVTGTLEQLTALHAGLGDLLSGPVPAPGTQPQAWVACYTITSGIGPGTAAEGTTLVLAATAAEATRAARDWVHDNDPYADPRIDPRVAVTRVTAVGTCQATLIRRAWIRDELVTLDGDITFDITDQVLALGRAASLGLRDHDDSTDVLWARARSPHTHDGPTDVEAQDAIADFWELVDQVADDPDNSPA